MAAARHRNPRKMQQESFKTTEHTFKKQGAHKKFANLSISRLRTMFPDLGHLSDIELKRQAIKRLEERG